MGVRSTAVARTGSDGGVRSGERSCALLIFSQQKAAPYSKSAGRLKRADTPLAIRPRAGFRWLGRAIGLSRSANARAGNRYRENKRQNKSYHPSLLALVSPDQKGAASLKLFVALVALKIRIKATGVAGAHLM
jgi:hypothetical protein